MIIGHSWASPEGVILQIDEPVADLLQRNRREIEGQSYLAITHPADRARNAVHVAVLQSGSGPKLIHKRYLTGEGGEVWVTLQTARIGTGATGGHLLGTFVVTLPEQSPRRLWREARRLLDLHDLRRKTMGADLFPDQAWSMMLQLYLAEAEGRVIKLAELAVQARSSVASVARWGDALAARGLVRADRRRSDIFELTNDGLVILEQLLIAAGPD